MAAKKMIIVILTVIAHCFIVQIESLTSANIATWIPITPSPTSNIIPSAGEDLQAVVCHDVCRARLQQSLASIVTPLVASENFYILNGGFVISDDYYLVNQDLLIMRQETSTQIKWDTLLPRTTISANWPLERDGGRFLMLQNGDILLYAGYNYFQHVYLNGLFIFDTLTLTWITLQDDYSNNGPIARAWGGMQSIRVLENGDEQFLVFSGEGSYDRVAWDQYDTVLRDSWMLTIGKLGGVYHFTWLNTNSDNCTNSITTCTDSKTVSGSFSSVSTIIDSLNSDVTKQVLPAEWGDNFMNVIQTAGDLIASLVFINATENVTNSVNDPNACSTICLQGVIPPNFPTGRDSAKMRTVGNRTFVFGGYSCISYGSYTNGGGQCFPNTMHIYDHLTNDWSILSPPPITDAASAEQNELWPSGRSYHNMELFGNKLWITAGAYITETAVYTYFNDMHVFNTDTLLFETVDVRGQKPSGRWDATSIMDNGKMWFLQGNIAGVGASDAWLLMIGESITKDNITASGSGIVDVHAGQTGTILLQTTDSVGNDITWGTGLAGFFQVSVVVTVSPTPGNGFAASQVVLTSGTVRESLGGNGLYIASYIAYNGPVSVFITFDGDSIPGSPFVTEVSSSDTSISRTYATSTPVAVKGSLSFILIQLQDSYNNLIMVDALSSDFDLYLYSPSFENQISSTIEYTGDGQYKIHYNAPPNVNSFQLYVRSNGSDVIGSPFTVANLDQLGTIQASRTAMMTISGFSMVYVVILIAFVVYYRGEMIMRAGTPEFMELMLLGCLLGLSSIFALATESDQACRAFPFILSMGFVLMLGSLYIKTWRLMTIFRQRSMQTIHITKWEMTRFLGMLLASEFAFNLAWQVSSSPSLTTVTGTPFPRTYMDCDGSGFNTWQASSYAYKALFLVYGIFLAIMTRDLPPTFNESSWIGLAIYNITFCGILVLLVVYAGKTQDTIPILFIFISITITWVCTVTPSFIVLPKLYCIFCGSQPAIRRAEAEHTRRQISKDHSHDNLNLQAFPSNPALLQNETKGTPKRKNTSSDSNSGTTSTNVVIVNVDNAKLVTGAEHGNRLSTIKKR